MRKSEEMELQMLSNKKRLTYGEWIRERFLWDKYHSEREQFLKSRNK